MSQCFLMHERNLVKFVGGFFQTGSRIYMHAVLRSFVIAEMQPLVVESKRADQLDSLACGEGWFLRGRRVDSFQLITKVPHGWQFGRVRRHFYGLETFRDSDSCLDPLSKVCCERKWVGDDRYTVAVMRPARRRRKVFFAMGKSRAFYDEKTPISA